ncbi:MAG: 5,6-dimethylbenzimidazole synthase [Nitrospirota bacterium]|nr:5,6-dimethylbenzimidazole synthase [Nitrospirota bacterium]
MNDSPSRAVEGTGRPTAHRFSAPERDAVYRAIFHRRDMREGFTGEAVDHSTLARLLLAAHHAPSVGFMQPWDFVLISDHDTREALWRVVDKERRSAAVVFEGQQAEQFPSIKIEALREASVVICVTVDPARRGPHVLGRNSDEATDLYSAAAAIQNLWLAARAEGLGMGWVSFYKKPDVRLVLGLPPHINPIGLLCLGPVAAFPEQPRLQQVGWGERIPLTDLVHFEHWDGRTHDPNGPWGGFPEALEAAEPA